MYINHNVKCMCSGRDWYLDFNSCSALQLSLKFTPWCAKLQNVDYFYPQSWIYAHIIKKVEKLLKLLKFCRTHVCVSRCNSEIFSLVRESSILNADVKGYLWPFSSLSFASLQSLLDEPNPNSPANSQAAQLYQENKREYEKRVTAIVEQSWVDVWAPQTLCYFLSIAPPSSSSHFIGRSFLPHRDKEREKKEQLYQKNSSATLEKKGRMKQPNHSGHKHACQYI